MKLLAILFISIFLVSSTPKREPKFSRGQCALFIDQPRKNFDKSMIVRVEGFVNGRYLYRWWTFDRAWASDLGSVVSEEKMFNKLFKKVRCPDGVEFI